MLSGGILVIFLGKPCPNYYVGLFFGIFYTQFMSSLRMSEFIKVSLLVLTNFRIFVKSSLNFLPTSSTVKVFLRKCIYSTRNGT
jgi:hypothetical protein